MQRLLISLTSLVAFAGSASAQSTTDTPPAPAPTTEPPAAPAAEPAPAQPAPAPAPAPMAKPDDLPRRLGVGKESPGSYLQFGLLIQAWFQYDETTRLGVPPADDVSLSTSNLRLRRAEVHLGGDIVPSLIKWKVLFDLARVRDTLARTTVVTNAAGATTTVTSPTTPLSPLQDAYITYQGQFLDVTFGQLKTPVSLEGYAGASKLLFPERAFIANLLGNQRDFGIRLEKTFKQFSYTVGLFNGSGQTNFDTNNQKDVAVRLEAYPIPGLTIAAATYDSIGYRTKAGTKDRWEGDLRFEHGPFLVQAEYIRAQDIAADDTKAVTSHGAYAALAYTLKTPGRGDYWQAALRYGFYDPNVDIDVVPANAAGSDERTDYEVAINYFLKGYEARFQLSYDRQQFDQSKVKPANNEVILATQVWF
jgi:hypothetical protein